MKYDDRQEDVMMLVALNQMRIRSIKQHCARIRTRQFLKESRKPQPKQVILIGPAFPIPKIELGQLSPVEYTISIGQRVAAVEAYCRVIRLKARRHRYKILAFREEHANG